MSQASCEKTFTLEVAGGCGIWDLTWGDPAITQSGPETDLAFEITPCLYSISLEYPELPLSGFFQAQNGGSFNYTGPEVACHLRLTITFGTISPDTFFSFQLSVAHDGITTLLDTGALISHDTTVYEYDFNVPLSAGQLVSVGYDLIISGGPDMTAPLLAVVEAVFSSTPP